MNTKKSERQSRRRHSGYVKKEACEGCGAAENLTVDHDHQCCPPTKPATSCGKCVRGTLCRGCNLILGYAKDNPTLLRALADYLDKG